MQNIVLVNVWHDDNKGDGGISEATIVALKQQYPNVNCSVVSMFSPASAAYATAHRHLEQNFPDLEVVPSPFFSYDPVKVKSLFHHFAKFFHVPIFLAQLLPSWSRFHSALQKIDQADLVIANGGQYLFTQKNYLKSLFTVFRLLYPLLVARSYGTPYIFCSQSFEFYPADRWDNRLARWSLSRAQSVWAREEISKRSLLQLGVPQDKVRLVPDAAFALQPQATDRVQQVLSTYQLEPQKFWVITVRTWRAATDTFLDEMATLVTEAIERDLIERIVLVVHVQGPDSGENDRHATQQLMERIWQRYQEKNCHGENRLALGERHKSTEAIVVIQEDFSPRELSAFYGAAQLMIGTRFHSVIFALIAGTPAYAISYAGPKTWGIMKLLGMQQLCADMHSFNAEAALHTLQTMNLHSIARQLPTKVDRLRHQFQDAICHMTAPHKN